MLLALFVLVVGFVLLMRGADVLVDGAVALSRRVHVPEIIIGLTIVAMGTSAPEAAVSIIGVLSGANGISIGNIIGSNIVNILLILGVSACIYPIVAARNTVRYEIPFVILITCVLGWLGATYGEINRAGATILIILFILFLGYLFATSGTEDLSDKSPENISGVHIFVMLVAGLVALVMGSNMIIKSASTLAAFFGMSQRAIGLSIVALGTSLPELSTCVSAAIKKKSDLVFGNIIGSNIFNILFVLGISGIVGTINFEPKFVMDTIIAIAVALLLWLITLRNYKLPRWAGVLFVILYGIYIAYVVK